MTVQESYSDNVDQNPSNRETGAFITEVTPAAKLRWNSRRVTSALDLGMTASHQTDGDDEGLSAEPDVAGLGSVEIYREHLFLDLATSISAEVLNTRERDTESNQEIIQNYSASPRLVGRFGNFADAEASYRYNRLIESGDSGDTSDSSSGSSGLGNSQTHSLGATLSAGPEFSKWRWSLNGQISESDREDDDGVSRRNASLDLEYVVDRSLTLLGSTGYEFFDDGDSTNDIDGLTWLAGFRWRPGPRTDFTLTYGQRDDNKSLASSLQYQISPNTSLFASYSESLETGDERLLEDLASIGVDPDTGALIDTNTGLPFDSSSSTTTIDSGTQYTKTFATGLTGVRGRNTFGVTGTVEFIDDQSDEGEDEDAYSLNLNWGRQLSPRAQLGANVAYTRNEFKSDGRNDDEYSAIIRYSYNIFTNMTAFSSYNLTKQTSTDENEEFVENLITLGVGVAF